MAWNKLDKETSNYTKLEKKIKGHLQYPWFHDWFSGKETESSNQYTKVSKEDTSYNKVEKE